jgi:hypothetical protein
LLALAALAACGVDTYDDVVDDLDTPEPTADDSSDNDSPVPDPNLPATGLNPVFSEIQAGVFTPNCASASCHAGGSPAAQLNLDSDSSYASLVGVASSQDAAIQRVVAGDPNASYLVQKLEGTAATGGVMPPSGSLAQATIDVVRQWITDGAVDDRVAVVSPVKLRAQIPASGSVLDAAPTRVILGFDRELNAASVDGYTIAIESTGGDGRFDDGAVPVAGTSIRLLVDNPAAALIDLEGVDLADDIYRIRVSGGDIAIEDLAGQRFDGDADGKAGGDYVGVITLTRH